MTSVDSLRGGEYSRLMRPATEKILIDQARTGQEQAFAQLIEGHTERIIGLAWRLVGQREEAEEIAQEAFLRLYKSLATFRAESSVATWLYRTVTRLAIDHLRREKLKRKLFFFRGGAEQSFDPLEMVADPAASPRDQLIARETAGQMQQVLNRLPPRQKAVFVLRHLEGLPLKEIAATLGIEEGTAKAHLHRAVSQFRQEFRNSREESP